MRDVRRACINIAKATRSSPLDWMTQPVNALNDWADDLAAMQKQQGKKGGGGTA